MKYDITFKEKTNCSNADEVFVYFKDTLKKTIKGWNFFVNWNKVLKNYSELWCELHLINGLVGTKNIEQTAKMIFQEYPKTLKTIPILLACREKEIHLLTDYEKEFIYQTFSFENGITPEEGVLFLKNSGILKLMKTSKIKSITDYVIGVEAGLDSNARKNRTGTSMENIAEHYIKKICAKNNFEYITQATQDKIKKKWNKDITTVKSNRKIDFAVMTNKDLFLIECNFYEGGGSKLKSTTGEYQSDFIRWKNDGHQFIWITDGAGWKTALKPLRETFDYTDYILNLDMLEKGILEGVLLAENITI